MLLSIGLLQKYGSEYRVNEKGWLTCLEGLDIDAEFSDSTLWKRIVGGSKRYYIWLGPKNNGRYMTTIDGQMQLEGARNPPRFGGLSTVGKELNHALHTDGDSDANEAADGGSDTVDTCDDESYDSKESGG